MPKATGPRRQARGVGYAVREYLHKHPDVEVWYSEVAKEINFTAEQVQAAVNNICLKKVEPGLERLVPGRSCIYRTGLAKAKKAESDKRIFLEIGTTSKGVILVQDQDGDIYKVEEL